jgi:hypothetical protein
MDEHMNNFHFIEFFGYFFFFERSRIKGIALGKIAVEMGSLC